MWTSNLSWLDANGDRHYLSWDDKGFDEPFCECSLSLCDRLGTEEFVFHLSAGHFSALAHD
jgi:hypothetical protein